MIAARRSTPSLVVKTTPVRTVKCTRTRVVSAVLLAVWGLVGVGVSPSRVDAAGSAFTSLSPARLLDTRPGGSTIDGAAAGVGPVGSGATLTVQISGRGGVPASGATSVVLNVTAVSPTLGGYSTVFPAGESLPNASNLNWVSGDVIANLVTVRLGTGGRVSVFNSDGLTNYLIDVVGWADSSVFTPVSPGRLLDTRVGGSTVDGVSAGGGAVGAGSTIDVVVGGRGGVPTAGVSAVAINVTAVSPSADGYTSVFPTGEVLPNASNLNWTVGRNVPNAVTVKLGSGGKVSIFNSDGQTNYLVDVVGWFAVDAAFTPISPVRLVDTRVGGSTVDTLESNTSAMAAQQGSEFQITGRGGIPATGVGAVVVNVTAVGPTADGYTTVWPTGEALPNASNINFVTGRTTPNLVLAKVGSGGRISIFNAGGGTNYLVDVVGWFAGTTPPDTTTLPVVNATQVSANAGTSCALLVDTNVRCWGNYRSSGGIGAWKPVAMPGLTGTTQIGAGALFGCALASGAVKCWGLGLNGQLGNGGILDSYTPVPVTGISTATALSVGGGHACVLLADRTVRCWGDNTYGQLGINSATPTSSATPVQVLGSASVAAIYSGYLGSCALLLNGVVMCWGYLPLNVAVPNFYRAIGAFQMFAGVANITDIGMGLSHLCARVSDGTVRCVGSNANGQLANGSVVANSFTPVVAAVGGAGPLAAGLTNTCTRIPSGMAVCWGGGALGQNGDGTTVDRSAPVIVSGLNDAVSLSSRGFHTCALRTNGAVACWGRGIFGELGDGSARSSSLPRSVVRIGPASALSSVESRFATSLASDPVGRANDDVHLLDPQAIPVITAG